ncbi:MAG: TA system VapC family ribonuclease toxin [Pyrinomonadaceae bacterium]
MILLDANILIYAYIDELPQHKKVSKWFENLISSRVESVAIISTVATAFLRISTNKRIFSKPSSIADATDRLDELFMSPMVEFVGPTEKHWSIYSTILREMNITGDVVMDAYIAAMAVEHGAAVASADKDFRRFSDYVKIVDPLVS